MQKNQVTMGILFIAFCIAGCGSTANHEVSASDYNSVVAERDAIQTELNAIKKEMVPKKEYESIVAERDKLKLKADAYESAIKERDELRAKLEEYEKESDVETIADVPENPEEKEIQERSIGKIRYAIAPASLEDSFGKHYDIDSFEITSLEESGDKFLIYYTCTGQGDYGNINFFCYDSGGYLVDKFLVAVRTNKSTDKFKVEDSRFISHSTVLIDVE